MQTYATLCRAVVVLKQEGLKKMDSSKIVQFIVVVAPKDTISYNEVVEACARAAFQGAHHFGGTNVYEEWLQNDMTTSVRRVTKESDYRKVFDLPLRKKSWDWMTVDGVLQHVVIFEPLRYCDAPRELMRLQVDGFRDCAKVSVGSPEEEKHFKDWVNGIFRVSLNPDVEMSAGKAAAQVAHAAVKGYMELSARKSSPETTRFAFICDVDGEKFSNNDRTIVDNGLTEVAPETVTCSYGWEIFDNTGAGQSSSSYEMIERLE